jgi:hypothetical protein
MCGDPGRVAEVLAVPHADGSPPYVVRWIRSGHVALLSPDSYATIIPAAVAIAAAAGTAESSRSGQIGVLRG